MKWDDVSIRVIEREGAKPEFDLDADERRVTFVYGGDPIDLLRMGIAAGRIMGNRRAIPMKEITLPD